MCAFTFRGNQLVVVGALSLVLAGCSSFAGLEPFDDAGATRSLTRSVGLSPQPTEAQEFVRRTRRQELDYVPVGVTPPPRIPLKNPQQLEAELAAKRAQNEAFAAARRPGSPYDGRIEPGYRPPALPPAPTSGAITLPRQPSTTGKASIRDRVINSSRKRAEEAAEENAERR